MYTELKNSLNYDSPFAPPKEIDFTFRKIDVPVLIGKKILGIGNVFAGPSFQYILASDFAFNWYWVKFLLKIFHLVFKLVEV